MKGPNGRLTAVGAEAIKAAFQQGVSVAEVARRFGLSYPAALHRKRSWENLPEEGEYLHDMRETSAVEPSVFQSALTSLLAKATGAMELSVPGLVADYEGPEWYLNAYFASAWIRALSDMMKDYFESFEVRSRAESYQPELLFDLVVAEKGYVISPAHKKQLSFLHHPILVIENEFSVNTSDVLYDFQKLSFADASEKLLITAERHNPEAFLKSLSPCANQIRGALAVAFVAHPRKWTKGISTQGIWRWTGYGWQKILTAV